jgi:Leucine-rich repeat (LRR) protein
MGQKFFISFNSADRTKAHWIAWTLKEAGHEVAVHDWEIPAGGNAPLWMDKRLAWADRLIAVISPDYVPARYSPMEWASQIWEDPDGTKGSVIPVIVRTTPRIPPLLRCLSRIDLTNRSEAEAERLLIEGVKKPRRPDRKPKFEFEGEAPDSQDIGPAEKPTFVQREEARPLDLPPSIDKRFKGREDFIQRLHTCLTRKTRGQPPIVALYGLGGIGKTRVAVEYAWTYKNDYSALLFAPADSERSVRRNLAGLSQLLALPQHEIADETVQLQAVLDWLRANSGWLLVLDGVNSPGALTEALRHTERLASGHLLMTSRRRDFPQHVEGLEVRELAPEAAQEFLLERTSHRQHAENDTELSQQLALELGWLALALEHAAAYIDTNHLGFSRYLDIWRKSSDDVLDWKNKTITGYSHSVGKTWLISLQKLTDSGRLLLERLAFLAPDPVPESLLDTEVPGAESEDLRMALSNLAAYSLVSVDDAKCQFSTHRLVQLVTRRSLHRRGKWEQRLIEASGWIDAAFEGDPEDMRNWPRLDALWPHASALARRAHRIGTATRLSKKVADLFTMKIRYARRDIELGISPRSWQPLMTVLNVKHAKFEKALEPLEGLTNLTELNLTGIYVGKTAWLAKLVNLERLDLGRTEVISVAPIAKLEGLRKLDLRRTKIRDVGPIWGLKKLEDLWLGHTLVTDISALAYLNNLVILDLSDTPVNNIAQLRGLSNLMCLGFGGTRVRDISALQGLTHLRKLDLSDTKVTDLTPLAELKNLEELSLNGTKVRDVSALENLTLLTHLDLSGTPVREISVVSNLVNLTVLSLGGCAVTNVAPLARLENLQVLNLGCTDVADIGVLRGLANLLSLDLRGTRVRDVGSIAELPKIRSIDLAYTDVADVAALAALPCLEILHLEGSRVRDFPAQLASKIRRET